MELKTTYDLLRAKNIISEMYEISFNINQSKKAAKRIGVDNCSCQFFIGEANNKTTYLHIGSVENTHILNMLTVYIEGLETKIASLRLRLKILIEPFDKQIKDKFQEA